MQSAFTEQPESGNLYIVVHALYQRTFPKQHVLSVLVLIKLKRTTWNKGMMTTEAVCFFFDFVPN